MSLTGRWCMNRLDPSGELRAGFGEACEVAAEQTTYISYNHRLTRKLLSADPFSASGPEAWSGHVSRCD